MLLLLSLVWSGLVLSNVVVLRRVFLHYCSSMRDSMGRTATEKIPRDREPATPVTVGRAGRSREGSGACQGAGVHVGGRGSRAEVGDAGVVYEMGKVLVDAVGRVLRRRPGGGDG